MTATVESETIELQASLDAFARLPEWLASAMKPEVVAGSLRRHVPALGAGELQLLACVPQRLRAKSDQWLARYQLTVGPSTWGWTTGRAGCPTCDSGCIARPPMTPFRPFRRSSIQTPRPGCLPMCCAMPATGRCRSSSADPMWCDTSRVAGAQLLSD